MRHLEIAGMRNQIADGAGIMIVKVLGSKFETAIGHPGGKCGVLRYTSVQGDLDWR